jgi:uncharacterized membrane protein
MQMESEGIGFRISQTIFGDLVMKSAWDKNWDGLYVDAHGVVMGQEVGDS